MNLPADRQAELERARAALENQWRIAETIELPDSSGEKAWALVHLEMKFYCASLDRCIAVADYARRWVETGNQFCIDAAVMLCEREGIQPPPSLTKLQADVARKRFQGDLVGGTAAQILKDNAQDFALTHMAKLCAAGATQKEAASKIARLVADIGGGVVFKASTLEKYYSGKWLALQRDMEDLFASDPKHLAQWREALARMPLADEALEGSRR